MKLLIDIPEHIYEHAKETTEDSRDEFDAMRAIANGTQQENRSEKPNTCGDVISRDEALQALCKAVHKNDDTIPCSNQRVSCLWNKTKVQDYAEEILNLPPVTPQQRTGRWIEQTDDYYGDISYRCSACNEVFCLSDGTLAEYEYCYCPNCGAKMEVGE